MFGISLLSQPVRQQNVSVAGAPATALPPTSKDRLNDSTSSSTSSSIASHQNKHQKAYARLVGSAVAGATELAIFHPVDTIAKRLMTSTTKYLVPGQTMSNLNQVIFKDAANMSIPKKAISLFPGLGYAAGYKVLQRVYKFGGQPMVADALNQRSGSWFRQTFGDKNGKALMQATAGSIIGVGEIVLLPLDVLKIKSQTNPESLKGVNILSVLFKNPGELWKGAGFTAMRNAPGSFALFGANAFIHTSVFKLEDPKKATFFQHFVGSTAGACASIIVAQPFDVIKTRIQKAHFGSEISGGHVIANLIKEEGVTALFKGLTPKIIVVGPKLIFSFSVAQSLIAYLEKSI